MPSLSEAMALLGVFLPLFGLAATFLLAWSCGPGITRWVVLALGPALTLLVFLVFFEPITEIGSLLAVALFLVLVTFLILYYPLLLIAGFLAWKRAT